MINLVTEEYCQHCPHFDPECERIWGGYKVCMTNVTCVHYKKCKEITDHLLSYMGLEEYYSKELLECIKENNITLEDIERVISHNKKVGD